MSRLFILVVFLFISPDLLAQVPETTVTTTEQQLENITENNEDLETEDDSYLQQMFQYLKNPINLNAANAADLKELRVLTPVQIQNFILYRTLAGKFIDLYELQAIPNWDLPTIQKIRPYIFVSSQISVGATMNDRLRNGDHSILIRTSQVLEKSKGYKLDPAITNNV